MCPRPGARGAVAQSGERLTGSQKVGGSNPPSSTNFLPCLLDDDTTRRHGIAVDDDHALIDRRYEGVLCARGPRVVRVSGGGRCRRHGKAELGQQILYVHVLVFGDYLPVAHFENQPTGSSMRMPVGGIPMSLLVCVPRATNPKTEIASPHVTPTRAVRQGRNWSRPDLRQYRPPGPRGSGHHRCDRNMPCHRAPASDPSRDG